MNTDEEKLKILEELTKWQMHFKEEAPTCESCTFLACRDYEYYCDFNATCSFKVNHTSVCKFHKQKLVSA